MDPVNCVNCKKCIRSIGCPGLVLKYGQVAVEPAQCNGCMLCAQVCPVGAISLKA